MEKNKIKSLKFLTLFIAFLIITIVNNCHKELYAEGMRDLVATEDSNGVWSYNKGYRPFFDYQSKTTAGIKREQELFVYAKKGETIYFGSSVFNTASSLNDGHEVAVILPSGRQENFDITSGGAGNINTLQKELNGPNYGDRTDGYDPLSIYIDGTTYQEGIYTFKFCSRNYTEKQYSSMLRRADDTVFNPANAPGQVASLDITVVTEENGIYTEHTGRTWADYLTLNTGVNQSPNLFSEVYVLTTDGYIYEVDLNGTDPYGFIFFATNRGLIDTSNNTSLYMSVFAKNNECTQPAYNKFGEAIPVQFHKPNAPNTKYDKTYKIFFNNPSADLPQYIKPKAYEPGSITNIYFTGINSQTGYGRVGEGGYFHFHVENATSYELKLDFNEMTAAKKDDQGNYVLDDNGNKIQERIQAVDRLNRKIFTDPDGVEVAFTNREYNNLPNPEDYTPVYIDGVIYLRNSCNEGENNVYWDGRDGNGHYLPEGTYGGEDSKFKLTVTPKAGEYHFVMLDVENNVDGTKVKMIGDIYDSNEDLVDISEEVRSTVYYNNNNPELLNKGQMEKKATAIPYCTPEHDKSTDGVVTLGRVGASPYVGNLGDSNLMDIWTYTKRQSDDLDIATLAEFTLTAEPETDPDDPTIPPNVKGTIKGKVFFDALDDGGSMNLSEGDYALDDVEVKLYKFTRDSEEEEFVEEELYTAYTDALGDYYFANLVINDDNSYYEVRVSRPNNYAHCTTDNQVISNIKILYDKTNPDDISQLDIVNDDVGFCWSVKSITLNKQWLLTDVLPKKIRINVLAYDNQGRHIVQDDGQGNLEPVYDVLGVEVTAANGWVTSLNLNEKDTDGNYITYYPEYEEVLTVDSLGNEVWLTANEAGYDYDIVPPLDDVAPVTSKIAYNIVNRKRCIEVEKVLDRRVDKDEGETFSFKLIDNTDSTEEIVTINIPKGEYKKSLIIYDVVSNHNYTIKEVNIPGEYDFDPDNSYMIINDVDQSTPTLNNEEYQFSFEYESANKYKVCFHNDYKRSNLIVSKTVLGNKGDTTKDFEYTFNFNTAETFTGIKTLKDGTVTEVTIKNNSKFTLKDGEMIEIQNLPYHYTYGVEESDYTSLDGYSTTVNDVESNRYEGVVELDDQTLEFKNTLDADSILGVETEETHSFKIVYVLGMFLTIYLILFIRKTKRRKFSNETNNNFKR